MSISAQYSRRRRRYHRENTEPPAEPVYEKEPEAATEEAAAEPEYTIEEPEIAEPEYTEEPETAEPEYTEEPEYAEEPEETQERDITIGELVDIHEELDARIQEQKRRRAARKKRRSTAGVLI